MTASLRATAFLVVCCAMSTNASAQLLGPPPQELQEVGIEEQRGAQVPLDLPFIDSNGQPVVFGDLFDGTRPVLLTLNYSNCPMLCSLQLDGLFTGPGSERRRFLDRLILCFDAEHGRRAARFERAMQQRNRLLSDAVRDNARFQGLEDVMAETGVAMAAARLEASAALQAISERRRARDLDSAFPWAKIAVEGTLEADIAAMPALDVEERYKATLRTGRERDRAAGRTLEGPHRSDLVVEHGPKAMPARLCSTGEQKALLLGLVLSHAELTAERQGGRAPILLLDEVTAHLDAARRAALFDEIVAIGTQAWMTGTDAEAFSALRGRALFMAVDDGRAGVWPQA
ncbi:MAG: hypothetical protein MUF80_09540 [Burkholderiales bacterium]|nr:hypothetical protein [Burkholderiales bacterium]